MSERTHGTRKSIYTILCGLSSCSFHVVHCFNRNVNQNYL